MLKNFSQPTKSTLISLNNLREGEGEEEEAVWISKTQRGVQSLQSVFMLIFSLSMKGKHNHSGE